MNAESNVGESMNDPKLQALMESMGKAICEEMGLLKRIETLRQSNADGLKSLIREAPMSDELRQTAIDLIARFERKIELEEAIVNTMEELFQAVRDPASSAAKSD